MKSSFFKNLLISCVVIGLLAVSIAVYGSNVSRVRHPNLAAAQTFIEKAINKTYIPHENNLILRNFLCLYHL